MTEPIGFYDGRPRVQNINITDSFWVGEYNMQIGMNRVLAITTDVYNLGPDVANFGVAQPPLFEFHPTHDHWHIHDFLRFIVTDSCGNMIGDSTTKIGYAMYNDSQVPQTTCNDAYLANYGVSRSTFTSIGPTNDSTVKMYPGWGDLYTWETEGNWIRIENYNGAARVKVIMNVPSWVNQGTNLDGDSAVMYVNIAGNDVTVINQMPQCPVTCVLSTPTNVVVSKQRNASITVDWDGTTTEYNIGVYEEVKGNYTGSYIVTPYGNFKPLAGYTIPDSFKVFTGLTKGKNYIFRITGRCGNTLSAPTNFTQPIKF